LVYTCLGTLVF